MKLKKQISPIIILLLFSTLFLSCAEENPVTPVPETVGNITGVVTEAESGRSLKQVYVTTTNQTHAVTTDIDGFYELPNVRPGDYTLVAALIGYETSTVKVAVDTARTTIADFILKPVDNPGEIRGTVIDQSNDQPIRNAAVETDPFAGLIKTDENGEFIIPSVPVGEYQVTGSRFGYESKTFAVTVKEDSISIVDFVLEPLYGTIQGQLTDSESGNVIAGASVSTDPATNTVFSDSSGTYIIPNVPMLSSSTQKYTVTAQKGGYNDASKKVDIIAGKITRGDMLMTKNTEFNLGAIEGTLTDAIDGRAIVGASVSTSPATNTVLSDSLGHYRIENVPQLSSSTQKYEVTADKAGYNSKTIELDVVAGQTTQGDMLLTRNGDFVLLPGRIGGVVVRQDNGQIIRNVQISTSPATGITYTDDNGAYLLDNVPVGAYTVSAAVTGYHTRDYTVTVLEDSTSTLNIVLEKKIFGSITGTVSDADSLNPVAGVLISTDPATNSAVTDSLGRYTLSNVPELTNSLKYTVTARKNGYAETAISVGVVAGETTQGDILILKVEGR